MGCDSIQLVNLFFSLWFQFTQPGWAATYRQNLLTINDKVSIHAARMGCDNDAVIRVYFFDTVSIHAARMGCDGRRLADKRVEVMFQFTQPGWAATLSS
ncbi:Uncharacterised protein [Porphyromonas cangingivalis]|nr:Uncharacterised protein [Porphyromonas cangingivalis]